MARSPQVPCFYARIPPIICKYWTEARQHREFIADLAQVQSILQKYLVVPNIQMEELRVTYRVDMSGVPEDIQEHAEVTAALEHVEFRENWLREILDLLYQLESTVPLGVISQLTRDDEE